MKFIDKTSCPLFEFQSPSFCFGGRLFDQHLNSKTMAVLEIEQPDGGCSRKPVVEMVLPPHLQLKTGQHSVFVENRGIRKLVAYLALSINDQEVFDFVRDSVVKPDAVDMTRKQITSELKQGYVSDNQQLEENGKP